MEAAASVRTAVSTAVILRNFNNMTCLPRFLFWGELALGLLGREFRRQTRHKLGNQRLSMHSIAFISRYGESGSSWPQSGRLVNAHWCMPTWEDFSASEEAIGSISMMCRRSTAINWRKESTSRSRTAPRAECPARRCPCSNHPRHRSSRTGQRADAVQFRSTGEGWFHDLSA
jgi:hypothetical protein